MEMVCIFYPLPFLFDVFPAYPNKRSKVVIFFLEGSVYSQSYLSDCHFVLDIFCIAQSMLAARSQGLLGSVFGKNEEKRKKLFCSAESNSKLSRNHNVMKSSPTFPISEP